MLAKASPLTLKRSVALLLVLLLFGAGEGGLFSQSDPTIRKDSPVGVVVYCPSSSDKDIPFDFERTLAIWYKRYKAQRTSEGGGAILLVTAPFLPKNSPEVERLKTSLGAEVVFPGSVSVASKTKQVSIASIKKKGKRAKSKKESAKTKVQKQDSTAPTPASAPPSKKAASSKKKKAKLSSLKKAKPVVPPGLMVAKEEAGLGFAFYSPSIEALQSKSWISDFKSQIGKNLEFHNLHFLLVQDPSPQTIEEENPITENVQAIKKELTAELPSIVLLSEQRALRFHNGEYSFGCGATPNSLKISVLELFFRNGSLIRISEDSQILNSKDSNKSWILE
ncbi:hypothetical protein EHQ61_03385 [Leptospira wolffii]|uniref:LIC11612 family fibronectin-binding protein n=1 Tax=Leptospira wolffii TaxID=409998 RepID=UPI00108257D8|nr:hypothetical protein [Leptospira wolffii]TGL53706.1 hypothetical protein EHQ61_03385 [Leptospira wolffii]